MKRGRRVFLIVLLLAGAGIIAGLIWPGEREPVHHGKKLSRWLMAYYEARDEATAQEAADAVRLIGTNGLPLLVRWLEGGTPNWSATMRDAIRPLAARVFGRSSVVVALVRPRNRPDLAGLGFRILRADGAVAIPDLIRIVNGGKCATAGSAIEAMACIGKGALPPLVAIATNRTSLRCARDAAVLAIGGMCRFGAEAFSEVLPILLNWLEDPELGLAAAEAFGSLDGQSDVCVSALSGYMQSPTGKVRSLVVQALGGFGVRARAAVPLLIRALDDLDAGVRSATTNALLRIAPEVLEDNEMR